jgi:hypothetical protein
MLNKKIFIIVFSAALVVSAGVYLYFTGYRPTSGPTNDYQNISTSTDGNIGTSTSNNNPAVGSSTSTPSVNNGLSYEDSPFGVFTAFSGNEFSYFDQRMGFTLGQYYDWAEQHMADLGAHWTRSNTQLIWDIVEPEIGKGYKWDNVMNTDSLIKRIYDSKTVVNWLGVFGEGGGKKGGRNPVDYPVEYARFVQDVVERYDGDGVADASPNVKVKYWQVGNETLGWNQSNRTSDDYIKWLRVVSPAIKKADKNAKIVLIAGDGKNLDKILQDVIIKTAGENLFDAIDLHYWPVAGDWAMPAVSKYQQLFAQNGYKNIEIWSNEHGTWQGAPNSGSKTSPRYISQTELQQAEYLVKSYVYNIKQGVKRIMWNNLVEWDKFNGSTDIMFNSMGLISDGQGPGEDPNMFNVPRLSYYSYKMMTEKLEGSDWKNIQTVGDVGSIYVYKFNKGGKPVWVAWAEGDIVCIKAPCVRQVTISGIASSRVKITEAIPKYDSGKNVKDYNSAFVSGSASVAGGQATIALGQSPVYIEESSENLPAYQPTTYSKANSVSTTSPTQQTPPQPVNPNLPKGYCGDGVCGPIERANPLLCPADCK